MAYRVLKDKDYFNLRNVGLVPPSRATLSPFWNNVKERWKMQKLEYHKASLAAVIGTAVKMAGGEPDKVEQVLQKLFVSPQKHYREITTIRRAAAIVSWPFVKARMNESDIEGLAIEIGKKIYNGKDISNIQRRNLARLEKALHKLMREG